MATYPDNQIIIAAAIILDANSRMLVVRKRGTSFFMQPGGKIEAGETPLDALCRELGEEVALTVGRDAATSLGVYSAPAANESGKTVVAHVFSAPLNDTPVAAAEIEALLWLDPRAPGDTPLAPLTRDHMLPLAHWLASQPFGALTSST